MRGFLAEQGISAERVAFVDFLPTAEYFGVYQRIDVALDPFPYGGGTTTCDALWMGVPVVSLAGQTAVGRGGVSILSNLGLPELVAQNPEQYVRIAVELAHDLSRLRRSARNPARSDAGFPADGRPTFCPERRGGLPQDVAALVCEIGQVCNLSNSETGWKPVLQF